MMFHPYECIAVRVEDFRFGLFVLFFFGLGTRRGWNASYGMVESLYFNISHVVAVCVFFLLSCVSFLWCLGCSFLHMNFFSSPYY